ncbi:histone-like nucleoid-structuring protein Lsr2 [Curtobacterium flaccumfaciens]|uniref:histone-like nucleoid-structuring protein Lsr2 n=1 Tax=Curtobacterium flaccumfaciens TaxID=2035 RepID=UPI003991237A
MAQKVITSLVDDLTEEAIEDGAGRTVQFAFDGSSYEIDLSNDNVDTFREAISDYVAAARKVSGRGARSASPSTSKVRSDPNELAKIRAWAMANGHEVAARGRISQQVRDAYEAAN